MSIKTGFQKLFHTQPKDVQAAQTPATPQTPAAPAAASAPAAGAVGWSDPSAKSAKQVPAQLDPNSADAQRFKAAQSAAPGPTAGTQAATATAQTPRQKFDALLAGGIDTSKYDQFLAAYKQLPHDDKKAEMQTLQSQNQFGLIQYIKDNSGLGEFLNGVGNAVGEAKFGS